MRPAASPAPAGDGDGQEGPDPLGSLFRGPSLAMLAGFFAVSTMQNLLLNLFGVDGPGLSLQLLLPLSSREIVRGKALGGALVLSLILGPALIATVLLEAAVPVELAAAGFLGGLALYLLFFPVAAWLSILFPKPCDLSKMGSEGKPHNAAALIGFLALVFLATIPAGAGFAGILLGGTLGALAAEAATAALAAMLFLFFSNSAAGLFELRREGVHLAVREG